MLRPETATILKDCRLRPTAIRVALLEKIGLLPRGTHFSVEEIFQELKRDGIARSLGSIYRTLAEFEYCQIIVKHNFETVGTRYEAVSNYKHDHAICVECGKIEEFTDPDLSARKHLVAQGLGGILCNRSQVLYITCKDCVRG